MFAEILVTRQQVCRSMHGRTASPSTGTSSVARVRQVELSATAASLATHRPPNFDMLIVPR
jgi:hypothetical protein